MAFGLFRMMFSAGGNAVPVLQQMTGASQELVKTSASLAPSLSRVGGAMSSLVGAASNLSQFRAFGSSIETVNAQASFLQPTLLSIGQSIKELGTEVTGLNAETIQLTSEQSAMLGLGLNLSAQNKATAKSYFDVAESVRSVGATGQVTSSRLASLSQTLNLFAQNTGQATNVQLQNFSNRLITASAQMKTAEQSAKAVSNANLDLSNSQRLAHNETIKISDALNRFSVVGGASSSVILRMANQLTTLATSVHPQFSNSLKNASGELIVFGNQLRMTEQAARQAGASKGGFQMMTDVSDDTAQGMRKISSASQGAMISMALMQRNVTGLAFSLIFLQFSGFLKLSLATAAVSTALIFGVKKFQDFVKEGKRVKDLKNVLSVITGGVGSFEVAMEDADAIAKIYGVDVKNLQNIIGVALRSGIAFTTDDLEDFARLLIFFKNQVLAPNITTIDQLASEFLQVSKTTNDFGQILKVLGPGISDVDDVLSRLSPTTQAARDIVDKFNQQILLFKPASVDFAKSVEDIDRVVLEMTDIFPEGAGALIGVRIAADQAAEAFRNIPSPSIDIVQLKQDGKDISNTFYGMILDFQAIADANPVIIRTNVIPSTAFANVSGFSSSELPATYGPPQGAEIEQNSTLSKAMRDALSVKVIPGEDIFSQTFGADVVKEAFSKFGQSFAHGGLVPGRLGEAVPIMAHAGELVLNRNQQSGLGLTVIIQNNTFNGTPQSAGKTIASEIMRGIRRNGAMTSAPLVST